MWLLLPGVLPGGQEFRTVIAVFPLVLFFGLLGEGVIPVVGIAFLPGCHGSECGAQVCSQFLTEFLCGFCVSLVVILAPCPVDLEDPSGGTMRLNSPQRTLKIRPVVQ